MPEIRALHGLRYDLGHIGSLADVIASPASELTPEEIDTLYKRHPANIVRVLTNREEPGDDELNNRLTRAKRFLTDWHRQGVLQREPDPAVYVYHQEFTWQGQPVTRRGFIAGLRVGEINQEQYEALSVASDQAMSASLDRRRAIHADVCPQTCLYAEPNIATQQALEYHIATATPLVAKDQSGITHKLWPVTDHNLIGTLREKMAHVPLYHADPNAFTAASLHRYELAQQEDLPPQHPANFVLTAFFEMAEPGFEVPLSFPLAHNVPSLTSAQLIERMGEYFDCEVIGQDPEAANGLWEDLQTSGELGHIGIYCAADKTWVCLKLTADGQLRMEEVTPERDDAWRELDSNLWEWLILTELLETADAKETYVRSVDLLVSLLKSDSEQQIPIAALLRPVTMSQYQDMLNRGIGFDREVETHPKPACGLVIHPFS